MTDVQPGQQPDQANDLDQDEATEPTPDQGGDVSPGRQDQAPATGGEGAAGAGGPDGFGTGS